MGRRSRRRPKKLRCFSSVTIVAAGRIFMTPITSPKPPYLGSIPHLTRSSMRLGPPDLGHLRSCAQNL